MREFGGTLLFSASDLTRFMGCAHATTLDLMHLHGEGHEPGEDSEDAALLQKQSDAHEMAHLARSKCSGRPVAEFPRATYRAPRNRKRAGFLRLHHGLAILISNQAGRLGPSNHYLFHFGHICKTTRQEPSN